MTLRTRRGLALLASFMFVISACGGATPAASPSGPTATSRPATAPAATSAAPQGTVAGTTASAPAATSPAATSAATSAGSPVASGPAGTPQSGPIIRSPDPNAQLAADQVLRLDLGGEPPTLDPNLAQDATSIAVLNGLHRGLVYYNEKLEQVPAVAESWTISDDAKTYTFKLRADAKYSNGDPIVAEDFVFSWKRLVDPRTAAPYAYNMCDVAGADAILGAEGGCGEAKQPTEDAAIDAALENFGVAAPDPQTFVVTLRRPAGYFLSIAGLWHSNPIKEAHVANFGEAANYVGSGPFRLTAWEHKSRLVIEQNPNWYGEKPTLTRIEFSMIDQPASGQAAYEAGALDAFPVPFADIRRVTADPVLSQDVIQAAQFSIGYYNFNNTGCKPRDQDPDECAGPTKNKNFRIALSHAIDKKALLETTFAGTGVVANSIVPPGMLAYQADLDPYPYDVEKAKAAMATALQELGYKDITEVPPLRITYNTGAEHETRVAFLSEAWTSTFADADGNSLKFEHLGSEFGTFLQERHDLRFDIARNGWSQDYPHPNNFLNDLFRCGGGNNDAGYCNREFDRLIDQAAAEPDQAAQVQLYQRAQTMLMEDAPVLPLRWAVTTYTAKPYVTGLVVTPGDAHNPGDLFYEKIKILQH